MADRSDILRIVYEALGELNAQLPAEHRMPSVESAVLLGEGSRLDSLGVVELLVSVEERVARAVGASVSLLEPLSQQASGGPVAVGDLADFVCSQIA